MPINRTSHCKRGTNREGRETTTDRREEITNAKGILTRKPVERATELPLVVHRTSQEHTLARLFSLVLFIISPRGNPPHHTLE